MGLLRVEVGLPGPKSAFFWTEMGLRLVGCNEPSFGTKMGLLGAEIGILEAKVGLLGA